LSGALAHDYLQAMGVAARYAWANRVVLAELVRDDLQGLVGAGDSRLVSDVPHNVVLQEHGLNIHRKGATPAHAGDLVLIPGSMGDRSFLATGLGNGDWLWSCSHGAGRQVRRQQVRAIQLAPAEGQNWQCVTLREERRRGSRVKRDFSRESLRCAQCYRLIHVHFNYSLTLIRRQSCNISLLASCGN
jgi:tRNA-splicing ligase RtcB